MNDKYMNKEIEKKNYDKIKYQLFRVSPLQKRLIGEEKHVGTLMTTLEHTLNSETLHKF